MIYSLRALLDKQPVTISAALFAVLNVFVVAGVVDIDGKTVSAGNTALVLLLGLFVQSKTTNTAVLQEVADTTEVAAQAAAKETVRALKVTPAQQASKRRR